MKLNNKKVCMTKRIIVFAVLIISSITLNAQTIMNIHQNDGTVVQIPSNTIDSIAYSVSGGIISNPGAGITFNGYTYLSIVLGNGQEWMAENLRTSTYANGDSIHNVIAPNQWESLTTGAWAHYENNSSFENPYGKLYNWYAVADPRNICPTGWHVPSDAEWGEFMNYLDPNSNGGVNIPNTSGGKMKSTGTQYWQNPNTGATNESGFSGLPGGNRNFDDIFYYVGKYCYWWSSTEYYTGYAWYRLLDYNNGDAFRAHAGEMNGLSIRCLKD